ncbi:hypothetical protein OQA88_3712 [Cercophora sp. LCS_1]
MAAYDEFAIFRRFKVANYRNLLYLQAEMISLEEEIEQTVKEESSMSEVQKWSGDWWLLANGLNNRQSNQRECILRLREKLEEYNDALITLSTIAKLPGPAPVEIWTLREWFRRPGMGNFLLTGGDANAWSPDFESDLLALKARVTPDPVSSWFVGTVIPLFHHPKIDDHPCS